MALSPFSAKLAQKFVHSIDALLQDSRTLKHSRLGFFKLCQFRKLLLAKAF